MAAVDLQFAGAAASGVASWASDTLGENSDSDAGDFVGLLSSVFVEGIWFFVGFALIRCGLFSLLWPNKLTDSLRRLHVGFLIGGTQGKLVSSIGKATVSSSSVSRAVAKAAEVEAASDCSDATLSPLWKAAADGAPPSPESLEEIRAAGPEVGAKCFDAAIRSLVQRCSSAAELGTAIRWASVMLKAGFELPVRTALEIATCACAQGNLVHAIMELSTIAQLPHEVLAFLVAECTRREDVEAAKKVENLAASRGSRLSFSNKEALLKLFARAGDRRANELFEEMLSAGYTFSEGLCGALLARCAESRCISLAEAVSKSLRVRSMSTLATYKALMKVYACSGRFHEACDLYEKVKADGIEPDAVMYGCLMKFAVKCGRKELSQEIFNMAPKGDVQNYMCLMRAAGRDKDPLRALELLRELQAQQPEGLDVMAYNCALDVCVMHGDMSVALDLFKEIERMSTPNSVTYNTLAKGFGSRGQLVRAKNVIRQMEQVGLVPDSASYNCLVVAAVAASDISNAWDIIEEMEGRGVKVDCYTVSIMMTAAKKARNPHDAERALTMLDRFDVQPHEDDVLFNTVVDACTYRRDRARLERVLMSFEAARSAKSSGAASPSRLVVPSVHTFGLLIKARSILGSIGKCWDLWREMVVDRELEPNEITLSCMMDALVCAGKLPEALQLFRTWQTRVPANTVIYSTLIKGFANNGDAAGAMEIFKELQENGVAMNLVAYTTLIDAQARAGDMGQAKELLRQMVKHGCEPNTITYSTIVKGYCTQGDLVSAFTCFREMLDRGLAADVVIFNTMLDGCVRQGRFDLADQLLEGLNEYGVHPSNFTLSIIVKMWGKRRQLHKAFEAVWTMPRERGFRIDAQVGTCLVSACIQNGALDRAIRTFADMKTWPKYGGPDAGTYNVLLQGLLKHGKSRQDLRVAASLIEEACAMQFDRGVGAPHTPNRRRGQRLTSGTTLDVVKVCHLFRAMQRDAELAQELCPKLGERLRAAGIGV